MGVNGWIDVELEDGTTQRIRVRRVHMEEDTGKLTHQGAVSWVDYNRAGVPLLEIVSEPDIHSAEVAHAYATKLRQILRYLGVNSGDLEKGVLRVEPNISVRPKGTDQLNTRTEVKNLNSFRALLLSSQFEIKRQIEVIESGGSIVQETRGWNEDKKRTFSQRAKEEAHDYRYFPDPDLPPMQLDPAWVKEIRADLPELADAKIERYRNTFGLSDYQAKRLAEDRETAEWFDAAVTAGGDAKAVANLMLNNLFQMMNESGQTIDVIQVTPAGLVALLAMVEKGTINSNIAKGVLEKMFEAGDSAETIVTRDGLAQVSDTGAIVAVIEKAFADNPKNVERYLAGQTKLRGFFVGQVMRAMKGKANPKLVNQLLDQELAKLSD